MILSTDIYYVTVTVILFAGSASEYCSIQHDKRTFRATGLAEIPDIPDDTEVVCLRSNRLSKLQTDDFSNLRSCVDLDLGKNQISEIQSGSFRGLDSLVELHLDENSLTELRPDMFLGLHALEKLMVGKNSISVAQPRTFIRLRNLKQLFLTENSITEITTQMFDGLHLLVVLAVSRNDIKNIEIGSFADLNNLNAINIAQNELRRLQNGVFNGLTALTQLNLWINTLTTIDSRVFDVFGEGLELNLAQNPLTCDTRLCWLKERIEDGRIQWMRGYNKPTCEDQTEWSLRTWHCAGNFVLVTFTEEFQDLAEQWQSVALQKLLVTKVYYHWPKYVVYSVGIKHVFQNSESCREDTGI